ncbi:MAG TPA: hypothetical protein VN669_04925 [Candidatus Acidoferrales bacterium]|jgi:hypothetical protein|nr:hypothetical protein [Candidatus Acidoferrales bacterium]
MPEHNKIRVLARNGARELTEQELTAIQGAGSLPCKITFSHLPGGGTDEDTQCPGPA